MISNTENQETYYTILEARLSNNFFNVLKHYEGPILHLQRLLVWEDVIQSFIFIVVAHFCFWYLLMQSNHVFGVIFYILLFMVWIDFWKHKIWPEIRAVEPNADDNWGELNPRLLSLKEMCDSLANYAVFVVAAARYMLQMRRSNPGRFCFSVCLFCVLLMFIGEKVRGTFVMYLIMLCVLLWPLVWYHKVLENVYTYVEPFLMQLQYTLQQRPGNTYRLAQSIANDQSSNFVFDDDDDLEEFVPKLDDKTAAVLAKAITDDSELSETDEEILAQELPTFSRATTPSNDENEDAPFALPTYFHGQGTNDNYEVPVPSRQFSHVKPSPTVLPTTAEIMTDTVNNMVKETFSSITQSIYQFNTVKPTTTPTASNPSTPLSDYEFVILDGDDKGEIE